MRGKNIEWTERELRRLSEVKKSIEVRLFSGERMGAEEVKRLKRHHEKVLKEIKKLSNKL